MTTKEVLIAAKALIDTPDKWFGGNSDYAVGRRCMDHAISAVFPYEHMGAKDDARFVLSAVLPPSAQRSYRRQNIRSYNDHRSHKACMRLMDRAIEAAS